MNAIRSSLLAMLATCAGATEMEQRMHDLGVSSADVRKVEAMVETSRPLLSAMWEEMGRNAGLLEPRLQAVYAAIDDTGCGRIETGNAEYCMPDNTIYYDPVLLAWIVKSVGKTAGSYGEYAVTAVLEHELGHAIAWRRERVETRLSKIGGESESYEREQYADCAAGAMTARALQMGRIQAAQSEVALRTFDLLGDPEVLFEGAHGDGLTRMRDFAQGYRDGLGGIGFCKLESYYTRMSKALNQTESCSEYGRKFGLQAQLRAIGTGVCN